jgi:YihY family inner membrane protein
MQFINSALAAIDSYQQRHRITAIGFGVIKKYGDDNGTYLAALLTYYGFLSLFPLLLAITSILQIALSHHVPLAGQVSVAVTHLFPLLGNDLTQNVHSSAKTGFGLILGIGLSLLGARGVADALRHAINEAWNVPQVDRPLFPGTILNSLKIIGAGGGGFLLSSVVSGYVTSVGSQIGFTILANVLSIGIIYLTLLATFIIAKPKGLHRADMRRGAMVTAISFQILQYGGSYLITRELHNLSATYGTFALVLGLLFYISLQAQIMIYAIEYNVVMRRNLWPRSINQDAVTYQDKQAYRGLAKKEEILKDENINVTFDNK